MFIAYAVSFKSALRQERNAHAAPMELKKIFLELREL